MHLYSLHRDELVYEVSIRGETPEDTVFKLRKQLKCLINDFKPGDILGDDEALPANELPIICDKLKDLRKRIDDFESSGERSLLARARALFCHSWFRLDRVNAEAEADVKAKSGLMESLKKLRRRLDSHESGSSSSSSLPPANGKAMEHQVSVSSPTACSADSNVAKWKIQFDGTGNPRSFLESVAEHAIAYNVSEEKLFRSAFSLFSNQGLIWYRGIKDQISSWQDLSSLLLEDFDIVGYDYRLMGEIRSRTQGQDEPIHIYFAVMSCLFSRLKKPLSEEEKVEILLNNVRPIFTDQLALQNFETVKDFKTVCRKLEAARQKTSLFTEPPKTSSLNPELVYRGKSKNTVSVVGNKPIHNYRQPNKNNFVRIPESKPKYVDLNKKVKFCNRCKVNTHSRAQCTADDKRVKCFSCGELGYTVKSCPKCNVKPKN